MGFFVSSIAKFGAAADKVCEGVGATQGVAAGTPGCNSNALMGSFQTIANTLIFLVGAISVIMIIIGGLRYVTSNGDASGIKGAKDTIMYAIVGVVVAMLSYAMVSWVVSRF